jgi:hypothetical protein
VSVRVRHVQPRDAAALGLPEMPNVFKQEVYTAETNVPPARVFEVIVQIGGQNGWYYGDWLWSLRGMVDFLLRGVGLRRTRERPVRWKAGDVLDFWRVEGVEPERQFLLRAEMKIGGEGLLGFYLFPRNGGTLLLQRALFRPTTWVGRVYWFVVYPLHALVFRGLIGAIVERAERF